MEEALPLVLDWIDSYLAENERHARPVMSYRVPRLTDYFSTQLLQSTQVVEVEAIQVPPLADFGLDSLSDFEQGAYAGVTYKNFFFILPGLKQQASTFFHEMIHVIQWDELGAEEFLANYAAGLVEHGYRNAPLEEMAYKFQAAFDRGGKIRDLEGMVREMSRALAD